MNLHQVALSQFWGTPTLTEDISSRRRSPLRPVRQALSGDGIQTSAVSPEEQVIQQRGPLRSSPRKRALQSTSPKLDVTKIIDLDSSMDSCKSPRKGRTPVKRKTAVEGVRKRLEMSRDYNNLSEDESPVPKCLSPPQKKKRKYTKKASQPKLPSLQKRMSALSAQQLMEILADIVSNHPELETEIGRQIPNADISSLLENLEFFRRNIYKSFPYTRWGSGRDAFCYRRVKTHLDSFKSTCINQGKQLQASESWQANIEYILKAWDSIYELPNWDNPAHNKSKEMCYKTLCSQMKKAIKSSSLTKQEYEEILSRLEDAIEKNDEIEPCVELVEKKITRL